ncbi:1792_t:CDS:2 [Diversispora eburnea]|uniref:1792_t:CDS:1 n=1 Tax=Diversispora eburnea TaxID=1213867 RepID=A0A9N9BT82_9GLOM|nr:1792_t:CDS:2 [Diversispora eburnea]
MSNFVSVGKKIIGIGQHAKELGNEVPKEPFFFLKPTSSYLQGGGNIEIPRNSIVHHEVELGVIIGNPGRDIKHEDAFNYIADLTARNLQKRGLPWSAAKGFDTFTPIGEFIPKEKINDSTNVDLWLKVNDNIKQKGNTKDMIFNIPTLIEYVSSIMKLESGDLILTGTPSGVGPIVAGDIITAGLEIGDKCLSTIKFPVIRRKKLNSKY